MKTTQDNRLRSGLPKSLVEALTRNVEGLKNDVIDMMDIRYDGLLDYVTDELLYLKRSKRIGQAAFKASVEYRKGREPVWTVWFEGRHYFPFELQIIADADGNMVAVGLDVAGKRFSKYCKVADDKAA